MCLVYEKVAWVLWDIKSKYKINICVDTYFGSDTEVNMFVFRYIMKQIWSMSESHLAIARWYLGYQLFRDLSKISITGRELCYNILLEGHCTE